MVKPGRRAKVGAAFTFGENGELRAEVLSSTELGNRLVRFGIFRRVFSRCWIMSALCRCRRISLKSSATHRGIRRFTPSTKAAQLPRQPGCILRRNFLKKQKKWRVSVVEVLLHVGPGTFRPVKEENVEDHAMHSEYYEITEEAAAKLNAVRQTTAAGSSSSAQRARACLKL